LRIHSRTSEVFAGTWISPIDPLIEITTPLTIVAFLTTILNYFVFDVKIDLDIMSSVKIMAYVPPHLRKTNRHQIKPDDVKVKTEQSSPVIPPKGNTTSNNVVLPRFVPSRKYTQPEVVEKQKTQTAVQEDEWTEIVRKKRAPKPEKTFEQMEKEMQEREKEEEETVWNKQEEESCWND
jgi:hypothetical protein